MVEQADPDVLLVSSKAEDGCIDLLRDHSTFSTLRIARIYLPKMAL